MFAIVTAAGRTKSEIIIKLREAIDDLKDEPADNCIAPERWEYEIFDLPFQCMGGFLRDSFFEPLKNTGSGLVKAKIIEKGQDSV